MHVIGTCTDMQHVCTSMTFQNVGLQVCSCTIAQDELVCTSQHEHCGPCLIILIYYVSGHRTSEDMNLETSAVPACGEQMDGSPDSDEMFIDMLNGHFENIH